MIESSSPNRWTQNSALNRWIEEAIALCRPDHVHLCDGSDEESDRIATQMVEAGILTPLNQQKRPGSFWCHSHPDDVARVEENTFICSEKKEDAGPTNNWSEPAKMREHLKKLFNGCMQGRTMYIVPYCMGPLGSHFSRVGIEITDSPYVVLNMKLMTRMGEPALKHLAQDLFVPGMHSVGVPLKKGEKDVSWPCNPTDRRIAHFPETREIWSYGSGYGGNALLGKKCFALRIASAIGRDEGWMAEHMLILGITNPQGEKKYIAAAFPSACGKTNLAMLSPTLPGWKVECVGDDIAWLRIGSDGRLYAINPEAGYFGVAPGTSMKTNPNAMKTLVRDTIFTNVALTAEKDVWWEGINGAPPPGLINWLGKPHDPASGQPAAHPNSRFTVSAHQCPIYDTAAENPQGVPISAILFGGRRKGTIPLVVEAYSWAQGVFFGAALSSETTAAAKGAVGQLRHDPFAMLPFCGYHMGDYFAHWLSMGEKSPPDKLPRIYSVNWFRKDPSTGQLLWPGYGENSRILKWIFERTSNQAPGRETPIGILPESIDLSGLSLPHNASENLFRIDQKEWQAEIEELKKYFQRFASKMPLALLAELDSLKQRFQ
ncbi:MAG: phosphoenolpyruvate carboxykinase (GTP) [Verrucomicrobiota bacterium]|nr:phosphoenolpyruvate carboxykinase (GTP) [Verrucomicrobiota bacterium]